MKVLSLLQPWASLVVTKDPKTGKAYKQIETRSWNTKYRGPLLIHASQKITQWKSWPAGMNTELNILYRDGVFDCEKCPTGAIIGMVTLVDTFKMGAVWGMIEQNMKISIGGREVNFSEQEIAFGDYSTGRTGWILSDPILFQTPIPCKGNLSIWNLPVELKEAVQEQINISTKVTESEECNSTKRTTRHMSVNIDGFIRNHKGKDISGFFTDEHGNEMTDADARKYLADCQAKGWKKIPCGDCEGFDHFGGGCPGHTIEEPSTLIASPGEGAVVVEPAQPNIECVYSGIQCDNPDCDYQDDTVTVDQWESFIGKPCPKCGENLMTEEDFKNAMNIVSAAEFMNSLTPEQLIQLHEELGSPSIDDMKNHPMIKDAEGLDLLKSLDQQVILKYNTHKEIKLESVVPVDQPSQPITLPDRSTDILMEQLRKSEIN